MTAPIFTPSSAALFEAECSGPKGEDYFTSWFIDEAHFAGWRIYHARPAQFRSGKWATPTQGDNGFFDCVLMRGPWVLFVELKAAKGTLSPGQIAWGNDARVVAAANDFVGYHVWRPADRPAILAVLAKE